MIYQALYRAWRPQTFSEVVGQPHIVKTLENMLRQKRIHHAFLLCGPRGTGKTTLAKLLAKALNCENGPTATPCLSCTACVAIKAGRYIDVLEIDGASNRGIDEIRDLREQVKYSAAEGRFKVYIIDEVHMLTTEAFNALLKTLEEPPSHVIFVLATTEAHKLPSTILSRCQRFDFRLLSQPTIKARLKTVSVGSHIEADDEALELIARVAKGGMRDALAVLDQVASYAGGKAITCADVEAVVGLVPEERLLELLGLLNSARSGEAIRAIADLIDSGKEVPQILTGLTQLCRDLLLDSAHQANGPQLAPEAMLRLLEELLWAEKELRFATNPKILLEIAIFRYIFGRAQEQTAIAPAPVPPLVVSDKSLAQHPSPSGKQVGEETSDAMTEMATTAQPVEPAVELSIPEIKKQWQAVLDGVRSEDMSLGVKLVQAIVADLDNGRVTLSFDKKMAKNVVENGKDMVSRVMSDVFGQPLEIHCVLATEKVVSRRQENKAGNQAIVDKDKDAVSLALSIFGGQEVDKIGGPK